MNIAVTCPSCGAIMDFNSNHLTKTREGKPLLECNSCKAVYKVKDIQCKLEVIFKGNKVREQ